ncbi:MAG: phosphoglycerate kinase [Actinomycetes bacterium]
MHTLDDLDVADRTVLLRADLNTPLDGSTITDDRRIRSALPTIRELTARGARVAVLSHLGRPKGEVRPELSLAPVARRLAELLGSDVPLASDTVGDSARQVVAGLEAGRVALLENVRFDARETSKDDDERLSLARQYAELGELFVSDGFGVVHRKQASVYDIALLLPNAAGRLVGSEVAVLRRLTQSPARPYVVVLGGAKVSDKLAVIDHLLERVDKLVVGGGMAFTLLAAQGHDTGTSLLEADQIESVKGLFADAESRGVEILLPVDIVAADRFAPDADTVVVAASKIPADRMGLDIGPQTARLFADALGDAKTVFWNGPMGVFEMPQFAAGTKAVATAVAAVDGLSVVGGGDSAAAVRMLGFDDDAFGHISTGGGASLEYLEGKPLPGLTVLDQAGPNGRLSG